jgi:hypothetical protein
MKIKRYLSFVNEKLGVPEGVITAAKQIYQLLLLNLSQKQDYQLYKKLSLIQALFNPEFEFDVDINYQFKIGDLEFKDLTLTTKIIFDDTLSKVECISWGVTVAPTSEGDFEVYHDITQKNNVDMTMILACPKSAYFSEIVQYLQSDKDFTIMVISHELKHVYDKYIKGKQIITDISDYKTWAKTRTGFEAIDTMLYYLYVVSKSENLVRPSEIAANIEQLSIKKSEFSSYIQSTRLWKELKSIQSFSYHGLKDELLADISSIRDKFDSIPASESDLDVVSVVLNVAVRIITEGLAKNMVELIDYDYPQQKKLFSNYMDSRVFNSVDEFFEFWQKKLNFQADKMIKKIVKLYDLCKDDDINPLMAKISGKKPGDYIVNRELYDKLVIKPSPKIDYKK